MPTRQRSKISHALYNMLFTIVTTVRAGVAHTDTDNYFGFVDSRDRIVQTQWTISSVKPACGVLMGQGV